jgi:hypothetical protein
VRQPNHRGLQGSLVGGVDVPVDGTTFGHAENRCVLQGRSFTLDELRASTDVRWQLAESLAVQVMLRGGLPPGVHRAHEDIRLRAPRGLTPVDNASRRAIRWKIR